MDSTRFLLLTSLFLVAMLLWQAWQSDYGGAQPESVSTPLPAAEQRPADMPDFAQTDITTISEHAEAPVPAVGGQHGNRQIRVITDVLDAVIDSRGGAIRHMALPGYPVSLQQADEPFLLFEDSTTNFFILQGGLLSKQSAPNHEQEFSVQQDNYQLAPGQDTLVVPLVWDGGEVRVTKRYVFRRGSYLIGVEYEIDNRSGEVWQGRAYSQLQRNDPGRAGRGVVYTYTGAVVSTPETRYEKIKFDDMRDQPLELEATNGWAAMLQHYFLSALIPVDKTVPYRFYTMALANEHYAIGMLTPAVQVAPGGRDSIKESVYVGPKLQHVLAKLADGLDLTVDYGVLWFIAKPLYWCLERLHDLTRNWGWAIILVTILLKVLFYRLSAAGYKSMANMRRVQPRIKAIQQRYKEDKARLNQAMMQIYKEEKINPLGGCFPIIIQIPVFIALYWVLLESVELRQASFVLWIKDLSRPDPYWVLPLIMGATMLIQQKLNPAPMDPVQEKVLMIMPFAFTIFFGFFPSGLVLYWVVNNILSIAQQWLITRSIAKAGARPAGK